MTVNRDEIHKTIAEIIEDWTGQARQDLTPETELSAVLDSFDTLDVVMDIEDEFGVGIDDEEVKGLKTISELVGLVERLGVR